VTSYGGIVPAKGNFTGFTLQPRPAPGLLSGDTQRMVDFS
jgi:hypothetical protein